MALLQMSKNLEDNTCVTGGAVGGAQISQIWGGGMDGGVGAGGSHWTSFYDQRDSAYHHHSSQIDGRYEYGQRKEEHSRFEHAFDGLALSDAFLTNYYSQKASHVAKKQDKGDSLKIFEYEGQESYKGSFEDICGLLHEDDDFSFLDNLDVRFKTLAEICRGSTIEAEVSTTRLPVSSKPALSATHKDVSIHGTSSHLQSQETTSSSAIIHTAGAQQTSLVSSTGVYVQDKVMGHNQTLLVQQPAVYYAPAAPVYVMEAQPTLLVTSGPILGLQENLLIEEKKGSGASTKSETQHYQSVVLVEKQPPKGPLLTRGAMQMANAEIIQSMEAQGVKHALHPSAQMLNTGIMQSTEVHEVRRAVHPTRRVMAGATRETEVYASMDMRVPQSL